MKFILVLFLFIAANTLTAQFSLPNTIIQQRSPTNVKPLDMDDDGDLDLLAIYDEPTEALVWFENEGNGEFHTSHPISLDQAENLEDIAIGDINGDGINDLIYSTNEIRWKEGYGEGQFSVEHQVANTQNCYCKLSVEDVDEDLDVDILYANDEIILLLNNGNGDFTDEILIEDTLNFSNKIELIDLDDDGDKDIISHHGFDLSWYENENTEFDTSKYVIDSISNIYSYLLKDADQDGDMDLLLETNRLLWIEKDGNTFSSVDTIIVMGGLELLDLEDFDGDNDLDVIIHGNGINWIENQGEFDTFGELELIFNSTTPRFMSDLDGDGLQDLVYYRPIIYWRRMNTAEATFDPACYVDIAIEVLQSISEDIDDDGDIDLLVQSSDYDLYWLENMDGKGLFNQGKKINAIFPNSPIGGDLHFYDVDVDGDKDIFLAGGGDWYENLGNGDFADSPIDLGFGVGNGSIFEDVDEDGDIDIIAESNQLLRILINDAGTYSNLTINSVGSLLPGFTQSIYYEDLDNDSDKDIIVSVAGVFTNGNTPVYLFENNNNTYSNVTKIIDDDTQYLNELIAVVDIDNDGWKDLFYNEQNGLGLTWRRQIPNTLTFTPPTVLTNEVEFIIDYHVADVDNNGTVDFLTISSGSTSSANTPRVTFYRNDIDSFSTPINLLEGTSYNSLDIADLNGDGLQDIILGQEEDIQLSWLTNLTNVKSVSGKIFLDENENGLLDTNEFKLNNQKVTILPDAFSTWSNSAGTYDFSLDSGTYEITCEPLGEWSHTTPESITLDYATLPATHNFGLKPLQDIYKVETSLSFAPTRCGFTVPFWLHYSNEGTQIGNGTVVLQLDTLTTFIEATPAPDSLGNGKWSWNIEDLIPTYSDRIDLQLQMPGVEYIGDTVYFDVILELEDTSGTVVYLDSTQHFSEINCAYDPNDKLVTPSYTFDFKNYTLFGETFEYTLRFQNTGTDTAFNIRLEDQLDINLDLSTFRVIAASHPYNVYMSESGYVNFYFDDILLPDENVDEIGSQGFIKYRIKAKEDLAENTVIENRADIFFDFNPPISTNIVSNILVSELPTLTNIDNPFSKFYFKIIPNPSKGDIVVDIKAQDKEWKIDVFNLMGKLEYSYSSNDLGFNYEKISLTNLKEGVHFVVMEVENQVQVKKLIIVK